MSTNGEGAFTYKAGTAVDVVATPDAGYRSANWAGDVSTIGNITATSATITMRSDYSITANSFYDAVLAAGWAHTVGLECDGTAVAAGIEVELAKWDLFQAALQHERTMSVTAGNSHWIGWLSLRAEGEQSHHRSE